MEHFQKRKILLQGTMVYLWWKMSPLTCCVLPHPGPECEPDQAGPAADWSADEGEWPGPAGHWSHSQWLAAGDWQHAPRLLYRQQQWGLFLLLLWEDLSLMKKYTCLFQKRELSFKGQVQGYRWFLTRFPLKLENDDIGETVIWGL